MSAIPSAFLSAFAFAPQTAGLVPAGPLDTALKDRLSKGKNKATFQHMGIALADLTSIPEDPDPTRSFAVPLGANTLLDTQMAIGSLSKIAAMYAAFRLQGFATKAAALIGSNATDAADVVGQITSAWKPEVSQRIPKTPHDFPNLDHIFDFALASPWAPTFKDGNRDWDALEKLHGKSKAVIDTLEFMDRMKLTIRFSDNLAAGSCVRDVSFQYMNGSLAVEGFADNRQNGILWLGGDFGYTNTPPIMGPPPWDKGAGATWVRGNARGIVSFFTLAWVNRLVSQAASGQMRDILLERPQGFATNITNNTPNQVRAWSKVGIIGTVSEGFIVEARSGTTVLRYAGAALGSPGDKPLIELASIFFDCIKSLH